MPQPIAVVQAGEEGKQLTFTQGSNPPNFSSGTIALLVTAPGATVAQSYACNVSNNVPVYITTGSEFPKAGKYSVQLEYSANGEKYYSPVAIINVLANLG